MISKSYDILLKVWGKKWRLLPYRAIKLFLNIAYPVYCKFIPQISETKNADNVVVSLTTFPARINKIYLVIESLKRQTVKPEKIILWLADTQFDGLEVLPNRLTELCDDQFEIRFCDDLRSHKKYYYSMLSFPNWSVITVDDDTLYPETLVENLLSTSQKYPNTICCNIAHRITFSGTELNEYLDWESGAQGFDKPNMSLMPVGCEGVLYPPNSLDKRVFDKEIFMDLCKYADDIWLKVFSTLNGTNVVKVNPISITYVDLFSTQATSLNVINVDEKRNDQQLNKMIEIYPELLNIWRNA